MTGVALTVLDRELYTTAEAARLLRVPPRTLKNWLEGNVMRGVQYPPVIRMTATGGDLVTWGEFVEAAFLTEYRRGRNVPLQHLRPVIDELRRRYGVPYPLAHFRPYEADRELVIRLYDDSGRADDNAPLIVPRKGQLVLGGALDVFVHKVEFADDVALRLRPEGPDSRVTIDPEVAFGLPVVRGVRTEVIHELFDAGDSVEFIAESYELPTEAVEDAIRFETRREHRNAPAAA
jgi:uncharacterized protein (DUF433 family)